MRIAHLTFLLSGRGGGVAVAARGLARAQAALGHEVHLLGLADPDRPPAAWAEGAAHARTFAHRGPVALGMAPEIPAELDRLDLDIVHLHGLFTCLSRDASAWRNRTRRPTVISAHGMLNPRALRRSWLKKRVFWLVIENANLGSAAGFQALFPAEAQYLASRNPATPVVVVPNCMDVTEAPLDPAPRSGKELLFLGRLHPFKGLPVLLDAFARLRQRDEWSLVLAGPDHAGHVGELRHQARRLGLGTRVRFTGNLSEVEKAQALHAAAALVMPSPSEGMPMAVLEALAAGAPVVITSACHLDRVERERCGFVCEPTVDSLAEALERITGLSADVRAAMGSRGIQYVRENHSWAIAARSLVEFYTSLMGRVTDGVSKDSSDRSLTVHAGAPASHA